ncbi:WcaF family extracellular polysaccharide biosynthesis acetyltransferase [Mucilaginibacter daejeonensis]|uniref:WcaF family extracellular polysaccharide biosynthesis acetyltransferase n=1 Tax=Mucilaginibacter daejeonensis TaxID=398049 RepID=UPI001D175E0B|nr:WcaF family extracellular polysaccharide biosynthesis acetyltransferase [Mucilaginibacter daejeonensis]UEG52647.1 WcaF family extracellular polysaccharide biosynthesis acetyltransferase [Mucilaginibacter daejeonensis]
MEPTNVSKVRLEKFDPGDFDRGASKVKEILWYLTKVVFFLSALPYPNKIKIIILKLFGAKVGKGVIIKPRVNIHFPWKLKLGDHVWIGEEVFILNFETTNIGNSVCISQRAFLCGGNHNYKDPAMPYRNGPITLMDGVWVGACCFIAPNVTIGADSVITAGSVVTNNIHGNGIFKGDPAVFIKNRW